MIFTAFTDKFQPWRATDLSNGSNDEGFRLGLGSKSRGCGRPLSGPSKRIFQDHARLRLSAQNNPTSAHRDSAQANPSEDGRRVGVWTMLRGLGSPEGRQQPEPHMFDCEDAGGSKDFPHKFAFAQPLPTCTLFTCCVDRVAGTGGVPAVRLITTRRKCQRYRSRCVAAPHLVPCRQIHACASEECKGARWHHAGFSLKIKSHPCFPGRATSSFLSNNHEDASLMQFSVGGQCVESARNWGPPEVELPGFIVGFPMARGRHFFQ